AGPRLATRTRTARTRPVARSSAGRKRRRGVISGIAIGLDFGTRRAVPQRARASPSPRPALRAAVLGRGAVELGFQEVAVQARDEVDRDPLRADRLSLGEVRAAAEALAFHRLDQAERPLLALGLALRQEA